MGVLIVERRGRWMSSSVLAAGLIACAVLAEFDSDDPRLRESPGQFVGPFLALSDADMVATAYVDGALEPLGHGRDELALFVDGRVVSTVPASNSVISWPQVVDVSPDGRFAFTVETKGPAEPGVSAYQNVVRDFPEGTRLDVFAIEGDQIRHVDGRDGLGRSLKSVEHVREGLILFVASGSPGAELVAVTLSTSGMIDEVRTIDLDLPVRDGDAEKTINALHVSPDGTTLAANIANHRIQFYQMALDDEGLPKSVVAFGPPTPNLGRRLSVGKWTPNGRYFVVSDTNGGAPALGMLVQGPGAITVLRPPSDAGTAPEIVSRAKVGRFPEGFDISRDGTRVAAVNMERTYLPESPLLTAWPGRRLYSVSLLSLDPDTGRLTLLDSIRQAGILPEDVLFDGEGHNLAVAVFHRRRGLDRGRGFIDFFAIEEGRRLVSQGTTQAVMRGPHDLVRVR